MTTLKMRSNFAVLGFSLLLVSALLAISIPLSRAQEAPAVAPAVVTDSTPVTTDTSSAPATDTTVVTTDTTPTVVTDSTTTTAVTSTDTSTVAPVDTSTSDVTQPAAVIEALPVVSAPVPSAIEGVEPTLSTDQADYHPGQTISILGQFFQSLQNIVLNIFGSSPENPSLFSDKFNVTTDNQGSFNTNYTLSDLYVPFYNIIATDLTGKQLATASFTDSLPTDFSQCSNNNSPNPAGSCNWIGSIIQQSNSKYFEGMTVPQRLLFRGFSGSGPHTITFQYQYTKAGIHAYDFLTTVNPAVSDPSAVQGNTGFTPGTTVLNPCANLGTADAAACVALNATTTANQVSALIPTDTFVSKNGVQSVKESSYQSANGGARSLKFYIRGASATFDVPPMITLGHDVPNSGDTGDSFATTTISFSIKSGICTNPNPCDILLYFGGHLAVTGTTTADTHNVTWGTGLGSSQINGGPYHIKSVKFDGVGGSLDNQIKGSDILISVSNPTISTTLSPVGPVAIGALVHDTAALTGATATAGGTVKYSAYAGANTCSGTDLLNSIVTVAGGVVPSSASVSFANAGTYSFQAAYSGDANNNAATSTCSTEQLVVNKASPTLATTIHDASHVATTSVAAGSTVHDSATISGGSSPTGTVTFTFFTNGSCTPTGASAGTVALSGVVADPSSSEGSLAAGSYSFMAHYNGDGNNNTADSACEPLTVTKIDSSTVTEIHADSIHTATTSVALGSTVHDKATVSGSFGTPTGNVTINWFTNDTCDAPPADSSSPTALSSGSVDVTGFAKGPLATGSYSFQAVYGGDTNYNGSTGACEPLTVSKADLGISTTIHDSTHAATTTVGLGAIVHDTGTVTGQVDSIVPTGTVTFQFFTGGTCADTGSPVTNTGTDGGAVRSADSAPLAAGSYSYQASVAGDANYNGATSNCEPLTVNKAQLAISTVVHNAAHQDKTNQMVPLNSVMHDTATVTGDVNGFATSTPTFTLTTGYTDTCAAGNPVANVGTEESGAAKSADSVTLVAGMYAYSASIAGNDNYLGATGVCEPFRVINPHTTISITPNTFETFPGGNVILTISDKNDGDVPLTNPSVDLGYNGATTTLTKLLPLGAFTGGDTNSNDIMDVGETWTWTVSVSISVNTTFSVAGDGIDPLGSHISPANGYTTEAANIAVRVIGTTRTLGFWQTHTSFTTYVFGTILTASTTVGVGPSCPTDTSCLTTHKGSLKLPSQLFGGFYAPIPKKTDGTKRGQTDQTRITLLQQLLAAKLNCAAFGCSSTVQGQIATADAHYASGNVGGMKTDIGLLDAFNNSGDTFAIPALLPATGKATPKISQSIANLVFWNTP